MTPIRIFHSTFSSYSSLSVQRENVDFENYYSRKKNISELISIDKYKNEKSLNYWYLDCIEEFQSLKRLNNYPGNLDIDGPNNYAIYWADFVLDYLRVIDFPCNKISASIDEGISICFISGDKYADLEIFNTQEILAIKSSRSSDPILWSVPDDSCSIQKAIVSIRDYINA